MRAAGRALLVLLLLTGLYAMVLASLDPWDLLLGALVSGALLYAFRSHVLGDARAGPGLPGRCAAFLPFVGVVAWDVVKGTWEVTLVVLHLRPIKSPGIVRVPVGERTPTGVAVTALVTTLSPGALLVEANDELMLFHVMDAADPDAFRREREELYQRYQRKVFP